MYWVGRLKDGALSLWTHDTRFFHRHDRITVLAGEESGRTVLNHEAIGGYPDREQCLNEIMHTLEMGAGTSTDGWCAESARLFAIDVAVMVVRRQVKLLGENDRQTLMGRLTEARRLVVGDRDYELGFLQAALESQLPILAPGPERRIWLTAIDALVPSPFRAALIVTRGALSQVPKPGVSRLPQVLRERLVARLDEGYLLDEPASTLFLIA